MKISFEDIHEARVVVQQSSHALIDTVWIFIEGGSIEDNNGSAHLDRSQAQMVIQALQEFLDSTEAEV